MKPQDRTIALVYTITSRVPYHFHTPLSILALGSFLESRGGYRVLYFDQRLDRERDFLAQLVTERSRLLFIGFSLLASYQITSALAFARRIRSLLPTVPLIYGGLQPTLVPETTLAHPLVDGIVIGEGELPALRLADALRTGQSPQGLPNVICKPVAAIPPGISESVAADELPFPYATRYGISSLQRCLATAGADAGAAISYELSRGCPARCGFCYNLPFHSSTVRSKHPAKVSAELRRMRDLGAQRIQFVDDNFSGGRQALLSLAGQLQELGLRWNLGLSITAIDAEVVERLNQSGCDWLFFGIESLRPKLLQRLAKPQTIEQIRAGITALRAARFPVTYSLMTGFPPELTGESEAEEYRRSLTEVRTLALWHPGAEIVLQPFLPVPQTPLYQLALAHGFHPPAELAAWADYSADRIARPWLRHPRRLDYLYLLSFLGFRYERLLKPKPGRWFYYLLHRIARWRWSREWFGFPFEAALFAVYQTAGPFLARFRRRHGGA